MPPTRTRKPLGKAHSINVRLSDSDYAVVQKLVDDGATVSEAVRIVFAKAITFDEIFNARNPLQKAKKFLSGQLGAEMLQRSLTEEDKES